MESDDGFWGAVTALRNSGLFRNTSARLLADLIELATPYLQPIAFRRELELEAVLVVVLAGAVEAKSPGDHAGKECVWSAGDVICCHVDSARIRLTGSGPIGAQVLLLTEKILRDAFKGSPELARSLNRAACAETAVAKLLDEHTHPRELILLCEAPGVGAPMEPLAHLLASAAREFCTDPSDCTGVVVTGAGRATLKKFEDGSFEKIGAWDQRTGRWGTWPSGSKGGWHQAKGENDHPLKEDEIWRKLPKGSGGRLFFVRDRAPNVLPYALRDLKFHRILYLTRTLPASIPDDLAKYLVDDVQNCADKSNPYFSSFIPTIILDGPPPRPTRSKSLSWISLISPLLGDLLGLREPGGHFRTESIDSDAALTLEGPALSPRSRLKRDLCRLSFDLTTLQKLWTQADDGQNGHQPFLSLVEAAQPAYHETARRWARAASNRQVGLALSGGGASSFRGVPLLRALHRWNVPVDVIGSSSGGSLLGAYYCRDGLDGLKQYVRGASQSGWTGIVAQISSQIIETSLDWIFRGTRVEQLGVRFVPLTMALADGAPPTARVVITGTLGEAVRVSGSMPLFFARTIKRKTVYSDGSLVTPLPVRALPCHGADLVFAFSSIPGPAEANPLVDWPGAGLLHMLPFASRFVDMWVANAFFLQDVTRAVACDAAVFIQATASDASMFEILRFDQAERIVREAATDPRVQMGAAACAQYWSNFNSKT